MPTEPQKVAVGPGRAWNVQRGAALVNVTVLADPAPSANSFAVSAPHAELLQVGDLLTDLPDPYYTAEEASEAPMITEITPAGVVKFSGAFAGGAVAATDLIYRLFRNLDYTDGGIEVNSQITTEDQEVDQEIDAVDTVVTKRETTVMLPLAVASLENYALGLGVAPPSVSGQLKVGAFTDKREDRILVQLKGPGGKKRFQLFHKCVNKGTTKGRAAKSGKTIYALEMKAYFDTEKNELFDVIDV
jgi:hypothetical protein